MPNEAPRPFTMPDVVLTGTRKKPQIKSEHLLSALVREVWGTAAPAEIDAKFLLSFLDAQKLSNRGDFRFSDMHHLVGVEVEVENVSLVNPNLLLGFWTMDLDGSLRNNGREFISKPIEVQYVEKALIHLFESLNSDIDFSQRTSVHVHTDVRGLTIEQVLTLIYTYAVVENLLFKFAGANRRSNIFCTPIVETQLLANINMESLHAFTNALANYWGKYSALNLLPLMDKGTLEFRQMPGTNNIKKLCIWIELLSRIRIFAYRNPLNVVVERISELNTNSAYYRFVYDVFGDYTSYLDTGNLLNDMEKPVYAIKFCKATNQFHQTVCKSAVPESMVGSLFSTKIDLRKRLGQSRYDTLLTIRRAEGHFDEMTAYQAIQMNSQHYQEMYRLHQRIVELAQFIERNPI